MKVSYLITCSTETDTLLKLLKIIESVIVGGEDECIVLLDSDAQNNNKTKAILDQFSFFTLLEHPLEKNYGSHKNYGIEHCDGDFIFQLDGDELPPESLLGENLHALLESNLEIEAYAVPRINDFRGVKPEHAAKWCWRLTESPSLKRPIVNFPDYQFRIFKRDYPRISFLRKLHEKIEGYSSYVALPADEDYSIYHDKTIEKQLDTNIRYNQWFTQEENQGHSVFK